MTVTSASSAISVRGLTKQFGRRTAVDNLDLEVPTGVVAGFVGPNGAGKTTTMGMLLGLVRPTSGTGTVLGEPLDQPRSFLSRVGALIETPAFYRDLSGAENLVLLATVAGFSRRQVPDLLDQVGLSDRGDDRYRSYSLGMKQRLGIAAALLGDPAMLVLDEPSNGLDPQGMREMRELIGRLARADRTVLVSSHVLSELEQVCDWLVLIDTGRSVYQGPAADFLAGAAGLAVALPDPGGLDALAAALRREGHTSTRESDRLVLTGGTDAAELGAAVNRIAFDAGLVLSELAPLRSSLEDRYLSLLEGGSR